MNNKIRKFIKKSLFISCFLVISGCGGSQQAPQQPNIINEIVNNFELERKKFNTLYGANAIQGKYQQISSIDCKVFSEAKSRLYQAINNPNNSSEISLGEIAALTAGMEVKAMVGCENSAVSLADYETARRKMASIWYKTLQSIPTSAQILLKDTNLGKYIEEEIKKTITENMSCMAFKATDSRERGSVVATFSELNSGCKSALGNKEKICEYALINSYSQQQAYGLRDDYSLLSELASRYHRALYICSPNSTNEYLHFHATLPKTIFNKSGFRLQIPLDPISVCAIRESITKKQKGMGYEPIREMGKCADQYGFRGLYGDDTPPQIFKKEDILGESKDSWMYDPSQSSQYPEMWSFGKCENETINLMRAKGINLVHPLSLKRYCK